MIINMENIIFTGSAVYPDQYPDDTLPEIGLVGRSNVGKSSFINCLANRKNIARTSSTPGKTRTINFYKINTDFYFVDFPGYGFAKVSKKEKDKWGKIIEEYLTLRKQLAHVFHILDIRHKPTEGDILMNEWLNYNQIPFTTIATKADKISRGKWNKHLGTIEKSLGAGRGKHGIVPFSAEKGTGIKDILNIIQDITK